MKIMKIMNLHWIPLCAGLALIAPAAGKAISGTPQDQLGYGNGPLAMDPLAPPGLLQPTEEEPTLGALKGPGGGLDVLNQYEKEGIDNSLYRPWKTRFDLRPYNLNSTEFLKKPEYRMGYRHFYASNPNLALAPNSKDRKAQSSVELMFGLTALASIVCGVLIIHEMSVFDTENLTLLQYQDLMCRVIILAGLPWLALGVWLFTVFAAGLVNPMRDPRMVYSWQCSAMAWFLLAAPLVHTAYFTVHALWLSRLFFKLERQVAAPMGRMLSFSSEMQKLALHNRMTHMLNVVTDSTIRHMLVFMEAVCLIFGYMLISFRWGANSQFCHPEVYWATNALVATVAIAVVGTFLTFLSSVLIAVYSTSPWVRDFARSFWDARLLAKVAKHEEKEKALDAAARKQAREADYEAEFNAWAADYDQDLEEQGRRHQAILDAHVLYLAAVNSRAGTPWAGTPFERTPIPANPVAPPSFVRQERALAYNDDNISPPSNISLYAPPTYVITPPSNITLFEPQSFAGYNDNASLGPSVSQNFQPAVGETVKPLGPERIFQQAAEVPVGSSFLGASFGSQPEPLWSGAGFAKPFGQR